MSYIASYCVKHNQHAMIADAIMLAGGLGELMHWPSRKIDALRLPRNFRGISGSA